MKSLLIIGCGMLVLLLQSCGPSAEEQDQLQYALIQGDWVSDSDTLDENRKLVFSFNDSLCSAFYPFGPFDRFKLHNGILFTIQSKFQRHGRHTGYYVFKVISIDRDNLQLVAFNKESRSKLNDAMDSPGHSDTIIFRKITQKNHLTFTKLSFNSSTCYGSCPAMTVETDHSRHVKFFGEYYTTVQGGFSGTLSAHLYQQILKRVRQIPFDSIDVSSFSQATDAQIYTIELEYAGRKQHYKMDGTSAPLELRLLFQQLMTIYTRTKLVPDASVKEYFQKEGIGYVPILEKTIQFLPLSAPE